LKHDPIVWESIQKSRYIEKIQVGLNNVDDWSPANLGLLLINFALSVKDIQKLNSPALDDLLCDRAMNLLNGVRLGNKINDLEEAIFIALAIREKLALGDSWLSIRREFFGNNLDQLNCVFACLYGLVEDSYGFLEEFISVDNSLENHLLLLHTILSNPIDIDQKVSLLTRLFTRKPPNDLLSPLDFIKFIQHLSLLSPVLAAKLSNNLIDHLNTIPNKEFSRNNEIINNLQNLEIQLLSAELRNLTNNPDSSHKHLNIAFNALVNVMMDLVSKLQNLKLDHVSPQDKEDEEIFLDNKFLIEALSAQQKLANHRLLKTNLLLSFVENKQYIEAENFFRTNEGHFQSEFINNFVLAINELNRGDQNQSTIYSRIAVDEILKNEVDFINHLTKHSESLIFPFLELLMNLELFQDAIIVARKAISYRKSDVKLHAIVGEASFADFKPDEAADAFYNAMLLKPEDLDIRRRLSTCLEEIGIWSEAYSERKHIFEEIRKTGSKLDIVDLHKLTECAINLGYFDEVIELSEKAILVDDEHGYSYSLIGKALNAKGEIDAASKQFEKGIQLSPQIPGTWISLADAQQNAKNIKGAIETLQAAYQAIPTSIEIHIALGEMQLSQNAITEALTTLKRGAEIDPKNTQIGLMLGTTLQLLGHLEDSEQILEAAHLRSPNHTGVAYAYAKVLLQLGKKRKAIPKLKIVVKSDPNSIEPFLEYAETVLSSRAISDSQYSSDEILNALHKALELDPTNPIAHALLGETLTLKEDFMAAKKAYQVALESDLVEKEEWFARLSLGMGRVALALGQEDVALASLQEALNVDPNNSLIHRALCEVYLAVNLPENALQSARAALNLAIDDVDTLAWYADQMLLLSNLDVNQGSQLPYNELQKQIQSEALNALHQANQIAPMRADLMVKLGEIQSILGEIESAIITINSLIANEHATVNDLTNAAELLSELGDNCGAIACLEKAYSKEREQSTNSASMLLINLARLYQIDGDNESAMQTLNRALENNSSFAPIYYAKASLLLELNNEDDSLSCVLEGLEKTSDERTQIQLHILAGHVLRRRGELKPALDHAQEGLSLFTIDKKNTRFP
jgi:tetratricopeptide (TPR) repeat protein